jgi:hypothetical protein
MKRLILISILFLTSACAHAFSQDPTGGHITTSIPPPVKKSPTVVYMMSPQCAAFFTLMSIAPLVAKEERIAKESGFVNATRLHELYRQADEPTRVLMDAGWVRSAEYPELQAKCEAQKASIDARNNAS